MTDPINRKGCFFFRGLDSGVQDRMIDSGDVIPPHHGKYRLFSIPARRDHGCHVCRTDFSFRFEFFAEHTDHLRFQRCAAGCLDIWPELRRQLYIIACTHPASLPPIGFHLFFCNCLIKTVQCIKRCELLRAVYRVHRNMFSPEIAVFFVAGTSHEVCFLIFKTVRHFHRSDYAVCNHIVSFRRLLLIWGCEGEAKRSGENQAQNQALWPPICRFRSSWLAPLSRLFPLKTAFIPYFWRTCAMAP